MESRSYKVTFSIEVEATSPYEALALAQDGVALDYADVYVDGEQV